MKFGLAVGNLPITEMVEIAQALEKNEFNSVWIADHTPATNWRDPFITMAAISQGTETIRIGCGVSNPYSRYAANIGVAAATLAELCGDRIILGMGAGGTLPLRPLEIEMWDRPVTAVRESIDMLRTLFQGDIVEYDGKIVRLKGVRIFDPVSIPLFVGTRGPVLSKLAGEMADGIIITPPFEAQLLCLEKVEEGLRKSKRSKIEVVDNVPMHISEDGNIDAVKPVVALSIPTTPSYAIELTESKALIRQIADAMRTDRSKGAEMVTDDLVREFAIAGNSSQCIVQIESLEQHIDEICCLRFGTLSDILDTVKVLGKEIIPSF
ncbi:MAG: LLM class flavin-dependent oxidoreductase [Candidatus Thorarchaeota archaeon]